MTTGDNDNRQSPEWVVKIKNRLDGGLAPDEKSPRTIGSVPPKWRKVRKTAFDCEMVKIGPFIREWHGEELKMRFLIRLLGGKLERRGRDGDVSRTTEGQRASDGCERDEHDDGGRMVNAMLLDDLAEAIRILEQKTRACYSQSFREGSERFVEMMVVDGCFVVELLRLYHQRFNPQSPWVATEYHPIFTNPRTLTALRRDLLRLENQLPFFVLEKLYELINKKNKIDHQHAVPLEVLAVTFFDPLLPQHNAASKLDTKPKAHLLDVFRSTFLKSVSDKVFKKGKSDVESQLNPNGTMRSLVRHFASELQEAGMQFKKWKGHDLLDIEFDHNTLRVPQLSINENTISLLLNFVAYEISVQHPEPFFTNYLMFWVSLVNSPGDIQIFRKHRIIMHLGSEKEAAELFMNCRELICDLDLGYLYNEIKEVNEYCERYYESKYRVWWRSLIRERFSSPWTCLSLFAAIILLLLTLLQTFYTMYAYYRPH